MSILYFRCTSRYLSTIRVEPAAVISNNTWTALAFTQELRILETGSNLIIRAADEGRALGRGGVVLRSDLDVALRADDDGHLDQDLIPAWKEHKRNRSRASAYPGLCSNLNDQAQANGPLNVWNKSQRGIAMR